MKKIFAILIGLSILLLSSAFVLIEYEGPETLIVGDWKEVSWEYEKMDHGQSKETSWIKDIDEHQKREISKSMIIHEAEIWSFDKDGGLRLANDVSDVEQVTYQMKGRGNILKLIHDNQRLEHYEIQQLSKDSLVLYFNFDLNVRGIVKLTFERI